MQQLVLRKKAFRVLLAERGIRSILELARRAGVSDTTAWNVSLGMIPSEATRQKIAEALSVEQSELWCSLPESLIEGGR